MKKISLFFIVFAVCGFAWADIQPITGTNTVGFVSVTTASSNTIITVPFEACLGNGAAGTLADLVATNGLTSSASEPANADQLVVLTTNGTDLVYYYYWLRTDVGWTPTDTTILLTNGASVAITPPAADTFELARGLGFWLKRVSGSENTVYLKGEVSSGKQATLINEGLNLVGIANTEAFSLNNSGIDWTGAYGTNALSSADKIIVCNGDGTFTQYYFYQRENANEYYAQFTNKWVESTSTGPALPSGTIQAGQGFWYYRRGASAFTFHPDGE